MWVVALDIHDRQPYSRHRCICALYNVMMLRGSRVPATLRRAETLKRRLLGDCTYMAIEAQAVVHRHP
ncbi:hypothetical protein E2C01_036068 [Portunus trituberculatus]|uniref:Uncharacterized protein n=1 Tax=Portunus trituberculatus TaxID=210409 RepID=A0A5B7FAV2_PORTR|nr:hypothetical protein [Portunus trituberculatus]